ncbi:hypothetical protein [Actinomadura rugatobispora]|uniref:Uncharacterized protein n=1 Tax=Actinomadura rugatobispora TaxID=1994 RepID=A0ABW0ZUC2_9ACTN|nr:hypothetical protein GCM10010200_094460 [Actinomadura rugatobispora]
MRPATVLAGLAVAVAATGLTAAPAHAAAPGLVDGTLSALGFTCTFANATTSDTPPNTLTIDHTTLSPQCGGGVSMSLASSPTFTFDDIPGTASTPQLDINAGGLGITCSYRVTNVTVTRSGTTRSYTGGPFTATRVSGGFLCPSTTNVETAAFSFH